MFTIKGDTRQLQAFADELEAAGDVLPIISEQLAEEAYNLAQDGFDKQRDPYGTRWKGRRRETSKTSGKAILVASAVMRRSLNVAHSARQFVLGFGQSYATFHQSGTRKMVQRMLVPIASRGLPGKWEREFKDVIEDVFSELFG